MILSKLCTLIRFVNIVWYYHSRLSKLCTLIRPGQALRTKFTLFFSFSCHISSMTHALPSFPHNNHCAYFRSSLMMVILIMHSYLVLDSLVLLSDGAFILLLFPLHLSYLDLSDLSL